ncbi:hypothetical protein MBLNU459_g1333t1 [Dothideomycetes sp. NU459]
MRLPFRRRDSGFDEPSMYAQPFDLDLNTALPDHIFSHEIARLAAPARLNSSTSITHPSTTTMETQSRISSLNPEAANFTPQVTKTVAKTIEPLRIDSTRPSGFMYSPNSARSLTYLSPPFLSPLSLPKSPNTVFLHSLMDRNSICAVSQKSPHLTSSPRSVFFQTLLAPSPSRVTRTAPATATTGPENRHTAAKSIPAVESPLVAEGRRHSEGTSTSVGDVPNGAHGRLIGGAGGVARRRGKSIADVAVKTWHYSPQGSEIVEEMVWPLTA